MARSADTPVLRHFNYESLDTTDAVFVQQQTGEIRALMKRTAQDINEIGRKLIDVKRRLKHGQFGTWLEAEFEWSEGTARRFMSVARNFSETDHGDRFEAKALYTLASPSTPLEAREEAIARAQKGELITFSAVKSLKQKYSLLKRDTKLEIQPSSGVQELEAQSPQLTVATTSKLEPDLNSMSGSKFIASSSAGHDLASSEPHSRPRAIEPSRSGLEILAIRSKESAGRLVSEETEANQEIPEGPLDPLRRKLPTPKFVQPGTWWQLGDEHLLYCGQPSSPRFQERLPESIALSLAFPPSREEWPQSPSAIVTSAIALCTPYLQDQDFQLFRKLVESSLMLYTEGGSVVAIAFLPDSEVLLLTHNLQCRWFCAEPEPAKCEAAIIDWRKQGLRAERVSSLRF